VGTEMAVSAGTLRAEPAAAAESVPRLERADG
jgi:hypothetical protein